jgi:subtilisin family serine protease
MENVMTETIAFRYGGKTMTLTKSENLIAVRPKPGMEPTMRAALTSLATSTPSGDRQLLGGFQIVAAGDTLPDTESTLDALREHPAVASGSHVFHTSADNVPFVPTGSVYIKFKQGTSQQAQEALLDSCRLEITEARDARTVIARVTPDSPNPIKVAATLQNSPDIDVAEPELATPGRLHGFNLPADPLLSEQWHLQNLGFHRGTDVGFRKGADGRVIAAWTAAQTLGSPQIVVAVIDDGFDLAHPDLAGPGKTVSPWDFTRNNNSPTPDATTQDWHGTACSGVAVGRAGGGAILGAAPGATLMPVRWGTDLADGQIEKWFKYVTNQGADVVSCSWGAQAQLFMLSERVKEAIHKCATEGRGGKGCVIVFAAGNSNHDVNDPAGGTVSGFAIHPDVIAVAASTSRDQRSNYSNHGAEIWVCAPSSGAGGWGILTSDVTGSTVNGGNLIPLGYDPSDYTYEFGGTSSACPLVAGVCALVLSANPALTAPQVRHILRTTARPMGGQANHTKEFGHGCVDAEAAVRAAMPANVPAAA